MIGTSTLDLKIWPNPHQRAQFALLLQARGSLRNMEMTLQTKQGEPRQFLASSELIDLSGTPCILTVGNDITERKRAEEALRRAHDELEERVLIRTKELTDANQALDERARLTGFAAEVSLTLNTNLSIDKRLRHCTEAIVRHLGVAFARIWTMEPGDLCDDCFKRDLCADRTRCLHLKATAGLSAHLHGEYRRVPLGALKIGKIAQGLGAISSNDILNDERLPNKEWIREQRLHSFAGFPLIIEGEVYGVLGLFARDPLSEATLKTLESTCNGVAAAIARQQAEARVRASETFLASVLEHLPAMVFVKDARNLRFVRLNKAGEALVGRSREELLGKSDYDFFPKEQAIFFTTRDREVLQGGRLIDIPEEPIQTKDQGLRFLHTKKIPLFDAAGAPQYLLGISEDITEQKQADEALRSAYKQLRELARKLESAKEAERQKIARELHDEFGQALTGLKLDLSWLSSRIARLAPSPTGKSLVNKTEAMSASVDALIDAVRETATSLRPSMLDDLGLIPALEWLTNQFRTKANVDCRLEIAPEIERIQMTADSSTALFRMIQEMLTNVIRHANASTVHLRLFEATGFLVLECTDNGDGIAVHQIQRPASLGLRGIEERAVLLGGSFMITGMPSIGTTARVSLPLTAVSAPPMENQP